MCCRVGVGFDIYEESTIPVLKNLKLEWFQFEEVHIKKNNLDFYSGSSGFSKDSNSSFGLASKNKSDLGYQVT